MANTSTCPHWWSRAELPSMWTPFGGKLYYLYMVKISLYVYIIDVEPPYATYFSRFWNPLLKILIPPLLVVLFRKIKNNKMVRIEYAEVMLQASRSISEEYQAAFWCSGPPTSIQTVFDPYYEQICTVHPWWNHDSSVLWKAQKSALQSDTTLVRFFLLRHAIWKRCSLQIKKREATLRQKRNKERFYIKLKKKRQLGFLKKNQAFFKKNLNYIT